MFPFLACAIILAFFMECVMSNFRLPRNLSFYITISPIKIALIATPIFVWNRKKYPRAYKITFASIIALSAIAAVHISKDSFSRNAFYYALIAAFTPLIAFIGFKKSYRTQFKMK